LPDRFTSLSASAASTSPTPTTTASRWRTGNLARCARWLAT